MKIKRFNTSTYHIPTCQNLDDYKNYIEMMEYFGKYNFITKLDILLPTSNMPSLFVGNVAVFDIDKLINDIEQTTFGKNKLSESIFSGGKGTTLYKTICSSLGETFERMFGCLEYYYDHDVITGSYEKLSNNNNVISPLELNIFTDEQLKDELNVFHEYNKNIVLDFEPFANIVNGELKFMPVSLTKLFYPNNNGLKPIGYSTSGGLTSHFSLIEGLKHGVLENIERHEINLSWYCKIPPKEIIINEKNVKSEKLKKYMKCFDDFGIKVYLHNVSQMDFYVVTVSSHLDQDKYGFFAGGGISNKIEDAIIGALEEYFQSVNNVMKIIIAPNWISSRLSNFVLNVEENDDPRNFKTFYQATSYYGLKQKQNELNWYLKNNEKINLKELSKEITKEEFYKKYATNMYWKEYNISREFEYIKITKVFNPEVTPAFIAGFPMLGHSDFKKYLKEENFNQSILPYP